MCFWRSGLENERQDLKNQCNIKGRDGEGEWEYEQKTAGESSRGVDQLKFGEEIKKRRVAIIKGGSNQT